MTVEACDGWGLIRSKGGTCDPGSASVCTGLLIETAPRGSAGTTRWFGEPAQVRGNGFVVAEVAGTRTAGDRLAAWMTRRLGSMVTVYLTVALSAVWMVLGARSVLGVMP